MTLFRWFVDTELNSIEYVQNYNRDVIHHFFVKDMGGGKTVFLSQLTANSSSVRLPNIYLPGKDAILVPMGPKYPQLWRARLPMQIAPSGNPSISYWGSGYEIGNQHFQQDPSGGSCWKCWFLIGLSLCGFVSAKIQVSNDGLGNSD